MGMPGRRAGNQGTGAAVCGGACPAPQIGTGVRKKGASPHLLSSALFIPITQC